MVTVRKPLWHLPERWREQLWREVVRKAERDELGSCLDRIYLVHDERGIELEFWFQKCSGEEASQYASAAIRDAASTLADPALQQSVA